MLTLNKSEIEQQVLNFISKNEKEEEDSSDDLREIELFCKCMLGYVDLESIEKYECSLLNKLYQKYQVNNLAELIHQIKWNYKQDFKTLIRIIDHFPIPKEVEEQLRYTDDRIDQAFVHKKSHSNVLLSHPIRVGHTLFYRNFDQSDEFIIDHSSDHLEGIVLFEVIRQAGLASTHHCGIAMDGVSVILESDIQYQNYIELNVPYYTQCIPAIRSNGGIGFSVFRVIQNDMVCAKGFFRALVYKDRVAYEKQRLKLAESDFKKTMQN
ncbi:hypothetical protein FACS189418_1950 [Clostridia bacterium]|nr:hypothetical protein FACS189418_1950 [Clostridia bacterium]